ncbi:hypothetical protein ES703_122832 [subsurface metagenome]
MAIVTTWYSTSDNSTDATTGVYGGTIPLTAAGGTDGAQTFWIPCSYYYYTEIEETEEQRRERESGQREAEKLRKEQEAAVKRAEELLKEHIGLEAFDKLYEVGYIELDSQRHKGRKYRVPANHMAYIEVLDKKGGVVDTLCVHPAIECPPADHILTRLALLQNDEDSILVAANHWGPRERSYYGRN